MENPINSVTRLRASQFLLVTIFTIALYSPACPRTEANDSAQELIPGFRARPDPKTASFQSLLHDPTKTLSFGFLRTNQTLLSLAVLHVPSSEPLWIANPTNPTRFPTWSGKTELSFNNGSLVISDPGSRVLWSSGNSQAGDRVVLLNSSNLQIQKLSKNDDKSYSVVWQSFDFPGNTLVEGQNFTDAMTLVSSNALYSMRLRDDFLGLYAAFKSGSGQIYWKHTALQAKAEIVEGKGPVYARVNSDGYLGMYQTGTEPPVDVLPFTSFQRPVSGLLLVRLEPDGNLKGYYWDGATWVLNYQAISDTCELPSPCGSYGLCKSGSGCSCIDNRTDYISGGGCLQEESRPGDFCGGVVTKDDFRVLRRKGVELPFKELMGYEPTSSLEECEGMCEKNCSCWGAVYNNASGFCYTVEYPIQTVLSVGDETKVGYFKVREGAHKGGLGVLLRALIGVLVGVILVFVGFVGFVVYKAWKRRRGVKFLDDDQTGGVSPGPYKDLGSASFRSIEMCNR